MKNEKHSIYGTDIRGRKGSHRAASQSIIGAKSVDKRNHIEIDKGIDGFYLFD
jgi:hypothetical protein